MSGITVAENGGNPGQFTVDWSNCGSNPFSLAVGHSCSVTVVFVPTQSGSQSDNIKVTATSAGPMNSSFTGTGLTAIAGVGPSSLSFGDVIINAHGVPKTVTLTNSGTGNLAINSSGASSPFTETGTTCGSSLASGDSCTFTVNFYPTALGARTGTFTVNVSVTSGGKLVSTDKTVSLSGTGETNQ
jgi:hypothetical protein